MTDTDGTGNGQGNGGQGNHPVRKKASQRGNRKNQVTPRRILEQERAKEAITLRNYGLTYTQIAERMGFASARTAAACVKRALDDLPRESAEELREINLTRLSSFLLALWPKTQTGDERAIQTALAVLGHMDRLTGTEAAQQIQVSGGVLVIEGDVEQYVQGMQEMAKAGGVQFPKGEIGFDQDFTQPAFIDADSKEADYEPDFGQPDSSQSDSEGPDSDSNHPGSPETGIKTPAPTAEISEKPLDSRVLPADLPALPSGMGKVPRAQAAAESLEDSTRNGIKEQITVPLKAAVCSRFLMPGGSNTKNPICQRCGHYRNEHHT